MGGVASKKKAVKAALKKHKMDKKIERPLKRRCLAGKEAHGRAPFVVKIFFASCERIVDHSSRWVDSAIPPALKETTYWDCHILFNPVQATTQEQATKQDHWLRQECIHCKLLPQLVCLHYVNTSN
ncbi:unnamed protein product [Meganyctiphanes norvegica]|uniref:Uncharacterized protein n=1 Tax=Meganyctiphanes norvegica TaxID=48144 RepID=A0AAV2RZ33_MEGNR